MRLRVGTAGWSIPKAHGQRVAETGSTLERYAGVLNCAEINSTFYRSHRASTYQKWSSAVPQSFRFSVKLSKVVTHEKRLADCQREIAAFIEETAALGSKREVVLVQLPPSLAFEPTVAAQFFTALRGSYAGRVALEPRHVSWFTDDVDRRLDAIGVARVAADPARVPQAAYPAGNRELTYYRLHGSPRTYFSAYDSAYVAETAASLARAGGDAWCIFDNTGGGAAFGNALDLAALLAKDGRR